ncbi:MAG: hypothetical protein GQ534_10685 [Candidatus Delongbacteria bacterium]|nr:hypothetical protein [Candidatus Delongbacteria bacterium]
MKKWAAVVLIAIVVGLFWSCSDDNSTGPEEQNIEVTIISPMNNSEFNNGDSVTVEVETSTNIGSINEVVLVIDRFTHCEEFVDNNNNGCFDREEFTDSNDNSNWDQGESYVDANFNNQYDGDFLNDSNGNNLWDYWDIDQGFTGFNNDVFSDTYLSDFNNNSIIGDIEFYLTDSISPYIFDYQAEFRYLDGDIVNDTGEPYIDQKRFYNVGIQIIESTNNVYDKDGEICDLILKDNGVDFTESYTGGSTVFWERLDEIQINDFYSATLNFDADSSNVTITYKNEVYADLKSSLGSETQTTPRFNDVYDSFGNGIQDEYEAYCSRRFYGSYDVSDNILGWSDGHSPFDNPSDYVEFIGSYTIFKCPVEYYQNIPNISDLTFDSYSTWIDSNNNGFFDTYDPLESYVSTSTLEAYVIDKNGNPVKDQIAINIKYEAYGDYNAKNLVNVKP